MKVWEVWARRRTGDEPARVGSVNAPDADLAALLARECFFRHKEATEGWVLDDDGARHDLPGPETLGGVTDKSYRRADGYVGVGAKAARVRRELMARGLAPPETGR